MDGTESSTPKNLPKIYDHLKQLNPGLTYVGDKTDSDEAMTVNFRSGGQTTADKLINSDVIPQEWKQAAAAEGYQPEEINAFILDAQLVPWEDNAVEEEEGGICSACNGSGEGYADGTICRVCRGMGEVGLSRSLDDEDRADRLADRLADQRLESVVTTKQKIFLETTIGRVAILEGTKLVVEGSGPSGEWSGMPRIDRPQNLFVCWCYLRDNPRMTSSYLVKAPNARSARIVMNDGDHIVNTVQSLNEYEMQHDQLDLTSEQQAILDQDDVMKARICIEAGT